MSEQVGSPKFWRNTFLYVVWGAALYGVLQIQHVSLGIGHAMCGAWGCGPPVAPLIAAHGFWLIVLVPLGVKMCRRLQVGQLQLVGRISLCLGLAGFFVVGLWELIPTLPHWLPRVQSLALGNYAPRMFLSVVTLVELPLIEVTLIGLALLGMAQSRTLATKRQTPERQSVQLGTQSGKLHQSLGG